MSDLLYAVPGEIDSVPSDKELTREIGRRLELTRRALGYNSRRGQTDFLEALNAYLEMAKNPMRISIQRWGNYERGRQRPPPEIALALYGKWGIDPNWVYIGDRNGLPHRVVAAIERVEAADREGPIH